VADRLDAYCMHNKFLRLHTHAGEWVLDQPTYPKNSEKPMYNGHRADFHRVLYEYACALGIPIHLGKHVASYHEDMKSGKAWVMTEEGEIFKGDVVVGADGVRSRARKLVLGFDDKPVSSGYAIYRAWFNVEDTGIMEDLLTREFVVNGDTHTGCKYPPSSCGASAPHGLSGNADPISRARPRCALPRCDLQARQRDIVGLHSQCTYRNCGLIPTAASSSYRRNTTPQAKRNFRMLPISTNRGLSPGKLMKS
jgi:hypothetical protein